MCSPQRPQPAHLVWRHTRSPWKRSGRHGVQCVAAQTHLGVESRPFCEREESRENFAKEETKRVPNGACLNVRARRAYINVCWAAGRWLRELQY